MSSFLLPILSIEAKAELIVNNLPAFEAEFRKGIDSLKYELITDDDFAKAKGDVKALKEAEKTLAKADVDIVNGSVDIKAIRESIATLKGEARDLRLARDKEIKSREESRISEIKKAAIDTISIRHPEAASRIADAIKNKRTMDSREKYANAEAVKMEAEVQRSREVVEQFRKDHGDDVCYDDHKLLVMDSELVTAELARRVERKAAALKEAELKAEADKLKAEAAAKIKVQAEVAPDAIPTTPIESTPEKEPVAEILPRQKAFEETVEEEMARFLIVVESSFGQVKSVRAGLKHSVNILKAGEFAKELGQSWVKFKSPKN